MTLCALEIKVREENTVTMESVYLIRKISRLMTFFGYFQSLHCLCGEPPSANDNFMVPNQLSINCLTWSSLAPQVK